MTAAARLPTPCCIPAGAAPLAPAVALVLAVEKVSVADPVAVAVDAVNPKLEAADAPVALVTTVFVQEQEESKLAVV